MKSQSKNRLWVLITIILLLANIGLLAYIVWGKQPGKKQGSERGKFMSSYLKNELGFDNNQMARFDSLRNIQKENSKKVFEQMQALKSRNLKDLGEAGFSDSAILRAASSSAQEQQALEVQMLSNLRDIRELCTPAQKQKFDTGFYRAMARVKDMKKKNEKK
jgi:Spy/CpxP family protein refolding chaperone